MSKGDVVVPFGSQRTPAPLDAIVEDLQQLRSRAGDISYAEIATRIARHRESRGVAPAAARVARSTVFDAFRTGRHRINPDLVAEIVLALGGSDDDAEQWRRRCLDARLSVSQSQQLPPPRGARSHLPLGPDDRLTLSPTITIEHPQERALRVALVVAVLVGCIGLNIFGNTVTEKFGLTLFLDMIGTATAAFVFGPWYGAGVGLATNVLVTVSGSPVSIAFAPVNIVGGLVWGYGYHRYGLGRSPLRFLLLNIYAGLACTIVAVPITVLLFDGSVTHASNVTAAFLAALGQGIWVAVLSANLLSSLADKIISGGIAWCVTRVLAPLNLQPQATGSRDPLGGPARRYRGAERLSADDSAEPGAH